MIATAAYVLQKGYHHAHDDDAETTALALVDLMVFMAFDLLMMTAFTAPELWADWVSRL